MIQDKNSMFSEQQAVTVSAASTNVLRFEGNDLDKRLRLFVQVRTAATADGAATVTFSLKGGADAASCSTTLWSSQAIGKASLTEGAVVVNEALPSGLEDYDYLELYYTVATGPLTAGKFDAGLIWKTDEQ